MSNTAVNRTDTKNTALLEIIKAQFGIDQMRNALYRLYKQDKNAALRAVNDERVNFPSLFALRPEIKKLGIENQLSARNIYALAILNDLVSSPHYAEFESRPEDKSILQWMFRSGCKEMELGDEYNMIMDFAAALLIKVHNDKSILNELGEMIFMRHRAGLFTYDAEWAFFECADPECLVIAANRLLSKDRRDVIMARRLLSFLPCFDANSPDTLQQHTHVMNWLRKNKRYLYYTGENSLLCGNPSRFCISQESKYLQKPLLANNDFRSLPLAERRKAEAFASLDEQTKAHLSQYSSELHARDMQRWNRWINSSVPAQIASSGSIFGRGARDGNS